MGAISNLLYFNELEHGHARVQNLHHVHEFIDARTHALILEALALHGFGPESLWAQRMKEALHPCATEVEVIEMLHNQGVSLEV